MNIDPEIDDGGLRFSEKNYYQQTDSDGEDNDIVNVAEDCDDYKEEAKSNIEKGDSGKCVEDKIRMDSNKCVDYLEEGVKVAGLRGVFETDWFLHLEGKNMKTLKLEDNEDISFRNLDEAEQFYSYYGFIMGFSIRKNKMEKVVVDGVEGVVRRSWTCSKQGYSKQLRNNKQPPFESEEGGKRKRNAFSDKCKGKKKGVFREIKYSRSGCKAVLWVKLNKKSGLYHVSKFVTDHNHELAQVSERYLLRSNRHVLIQDIYEVQALREAQVSTSAAYDYLLKQSGGAEFVGFLLKDLYNRLDADKKINKQHGDAEAALNWMRLKGQEDPLFFARYTKDAEGRLSSLFWRDQTSLLDYEAYGDVLIVDSTYKTNIYGMPFVMFVGANNHRGTVLFGCALLCDEKEETFSWLIEKFLDSMNNIPPKAIVTDGDEAMRNAMLKLMPNVRHRLCAWHIGRNVCQNMKNVEVQKKLGRLIYASYSVPEWEEEWKCMIIEYGLEDSGWMKLLYDKRERWAEAFCKGHFYGGICSTQRCEGMNSKAKKLVGRFTTLNCFVRRFGRSIDRLRDRVCLDNFKSKNHTRNFNTHMKSIEEEAFKTFTDDIFLVIKGQIMLESRFFVSSRILFGDCRNMMVYVGQYDQPSRSWLVECTSDSSEGDVTYECNCKLFESDGIPCCHIFSVLKSDRVMAYPKSLICKRWEKSGPNIITRSKSCLASDDKASQVMRYTALIGAAKRVCHNMSQSAEGFDQMMADLGMLEEDSLNYRSMKKAKLNLRGSENVVGDPIKARTKGMQGKIPLTNNNGGEPPKCGMCGLPGHNLRTCALNPDVSKGKRTRAKSVAQSDGTRAAEDSNVPQLRTPARSVANEVNEESLEVPWPSGVRAQMQPSINFRFDLNECTGNVMCYVPDLNSQVEESGQG